MGKDSRPFLFTLVVVAVIGVAIAFKVDGALLTTATAQGPADATNSAKSTILEQRAERERLKTEAMAASQAARIQRQQVTEGALMVALVVLLVGGSGVLIYAMWNRTQTFTPNPGGLYSIRKQGNKLINPNYVEQATYDIGTEQAPADRERIGREVRGIQLMNAATKSQRVFSPDQIGQAVVKGIGQKWEERIPTPREIPAEEGQALLSRARMIEGGEDE
jgi:hypothetical protein